ncbi:MAG: radical SAM family heme chaperone HemW [Gammaproteobacteria bacterium]
MQQHSEPSRAEGEGPSVPLSLYVHLPWCVAKCPYCDFNSHALRGSLPEDDYLSALLADLSTETGRAEERQIVSVFFGGGTPSLFSAAAIGRFLDSVATTLKLASDVEVTLEANPGTIEHGDFAAYRDAGINRISLGAQSFDDGLLKAIGRIHGHADVHRAIDDIVAAGYGRFNIDLMHGLPGQTEETAHNDLVTALEYDPPHLSWYELTIEPNTLFWHERPQLPDDDLLWQIYMDGCETLTAAGYTRYEVSAFAAPGAQSVHNRNYWEFGDYLGIGAGAHGKLTDQSTGRVERRIKARHPSDYTRHAGSDACVVEHRSLDENDLVFEFALNALRLTDGFDEAFFEARTGLGRSSIKSPLRAALARGLVEHDRQRWRASPLGFRFLNDLQSMFLPEPVPAGSDAARLQSGFEAPKSA